ncbi:Hypothetical predicted protein [Marmota monax]|uniref:Uncharacterized protein n=1 Tax=Marmota monax TaxID=9995 RepID=A0A5E4C744_MARMO|nr:hypothetical protein GHT09_011491 [Marmota monax]VTJ77170.1 Hypothetical predicted protein [Marmota monax]
MAWSSAGSDLCAKAKGSQEAAGQCAQGLRLEALQWRRFTDLWFSGSGAQGSFWLQNVLAPLWARPPHPALPPRSVFVLVSGTKSGVGQGSQWAYGPKPGHLSPPGMTKPQQRGLCLWPQLAALGSGGATKVWPQPTCPVFPLGLTCRVASWPWVHREVLHPLPGCHCVLWGHSEAQTLPAAQPRAAPR